MALAVRILMVMLAYVLACVAAAVIFIIGTLTLHGADLNALDAPTWTFWVLIAIATVMFGAIAIMPSFLVIVLAEGFAFRSVVLYGVLGCVLALALGNVFGAAGSPVHQQEVLAASGIAGGLVYWLFAGRKAGAWKSVMDRDAPTNLTR
jgi:hypothetical protein